ncbi:MAG TPA: glycosyltransferase family A protein [Candidatus Limnocylindrales bacterium]|nr:glycosyltransferase family A protein [Candidatus Limnocylindrales bacterium]
MSDVPTTHNPTVAVILPTHARPHTIAYSIRSVLRQTWPHLELHVVGDGCDEATAEVVRSFDDPRVIFHPFPKAPGYGYANRNLVLRSLRSDYVTHASDDDLWFPDHLEHAMTALDGGRLDYIVTRSVHVRSSGELDPHFFAFDWRLPLVSGFLHNWFVGATNVVLRRAVLDTIGYWNEALMRFGDRELYERCRTARLAGEYRNHPTILRFYAQDWDHLYKGLAEPPQARFFELLGDPAWCSFVRSQAAPGRRSLAARRRQWLDMLRFTRVSGPKFVRFQIERWRKPC